MKRSDFLERHGLSRRTIWARIPEGEFKPTTSDRLAAWELYVELETRGLLSNDQPGQTRGALEDITALASVAREILRRHGPDCREFAELVMPLVKEVLRPLALLAKVRLDRCGYSQRVPLASFGVEFEKWQPELRCVARALKAMALPAPDP